MSSSRRSSFPEQLQVISLLCGSAHYALSRTLFAHTDCSEAYDPAFSDSRHLVRNEIRCAEEIA